MSFKVFSFIPAKKCPVGINYVFLWFSSWPLKHSNSKYLIETLKKPALPPMECRFLLLSLQVKTNISAFSSFLREIMNFQGAEILKNRGPIKWAQNRKQNRKGVLLRNDFSIYEVLDITQMFKTFLAQVRNDWE